MDAITYPAAGKSLPAEKSTTLASHFRTSPTQRPVTSRRRTPPVGRTHTNGYPPTASTSAIHRFLSILLRWPGAAWRYVEGVHFTDPGLRCVQQHEIGGAAEAEIFTAISTCAFAKANTSVADIILKLSPEAATLLRTIAGTAHPDISGPEDAARHLEALTAEILAAHEASLKPLVELKSYHKTDLGNAERFADQHGESVRYCHPLKAWFIYDEKSGRWKTDNVGAVGQLGKSTVRGIYMEASAAETVGERKATAEWARKSESANSIGAMIKLARGSLPILTESLDTDPWLLNCHNTAIDLRTGAPVRHERKFLITKLAPVGYDPRATCPVFEQFLRAIMQGNIALIKFVQRAIGYALTGNTREQALFIFYGTGANGKSTLLDIVMELLGDYAQQTPADTLMAKRQGGIPNDIARLRGARFAAAVETEEGQRLAESLIKQSTGGDTLTARFLNSEFFEFKPQFKIFLATNHKPVIRGTDHAIWRRVRLVPFGVTIPDEEQDKKLPQKLRAELPGILNWAIQGCLDWQRDGLGLPDAVKAATATYRDEMDTLGQFIAERCVAAPDCTARSSDLYADYKTWSSDNGEREMTQTMFAKRLLERRFEKTRSSVGVFWRGIGLQETESV